MSKKKFLLILAFALLLCISVSPVATLAGNDVSAWQSNRPIKGLHLKNVPRKNWVSTSKVVEAQALLRNVALHVSGHELTLTGELSAGSQKIALNKTGELYQSSFVEGDYLIEFGEGIGDTPDQFALVHAVIRKNISETDRDLLNKRLVGRDLLILLFYDEQNSDIVYFEFELAKAGIENILQQLDQIYERLPRAEIDSWHHKILEPEVIIFEEYIEECSEFSILTQTGSFAIRTTCQLRYGSGSIWNGSTHEMRVLTSGNLPFPFAPEAYLQTDVVVEMKRVRWDDGTIHDNQGHVVLGAWSDPVRVQTDTLRYFNTQRDYLRRLEYGGTVEQRTTSTPSISVGTTFGTIFGVDIGTYTLPQTIQLGTGRNIYVAGANDFPFRANHSKTDTRLRSVGHNYRTNYVITSTGPGNGGQKQVIVRFTLPFYNAPGTLSGTLIETRVPAGSIIYTSN